MVKRIRASLGAIGAVGTSVYGTALLVGALVVAPMALAQTPGTPAAPPPRPVVRPPGATSPRTAPPAATSPGTTPPAVTPGTAPPAASPGTAAPTATAPSIRLVGVILKDDQAPLALIETPQQRQALYRVGDTVGEARIEQILEDRAIVRYRDQQVVLRLATSPGASPSRSVAAPGSGPPPAASGAGDQDVAARMRDLATRLRDNPNDTEAGAELRRLRTEQRSGGVSARDLAQAGAAPDVASAQPEEDGVRLMEVSEEGLLARLGLRSGDIVRTVNQRPVGPDRSLGDALAAAATGSDRVLIELTRGGAQTRQEHRLVP